MLLELIIASRCGCVVASALEMKGRDCTENDRFSIQADPSFLGG